MSVRAMFYVKDKKALPNNSADPTEPHHEHIVLAAAFGSYLKNLPESEFNNEDWSKWTPSGELHLTITNPGAYEQFELGSVYQIDIEKVA